MHTKANVTFRKCNFNETWKKLLLLHNLFLNLLKTRSNKFFDWSGVQLIFCSWLTTTLLSNDALSHAKSSHAVHRTLFGLFPSLDHLPYHLDLPNIPWVNYLLLYTMSSGKVCTQCIRPANASQLSDHS